MQIDPDTPRAQPTEEVARSLNQAREQTTEAVGWLVTDGTKLAIWLGVAVGIFIGIRALRTVIYAWLNTEKKPAGAVRNLLARVVKATNSVVIFFFALVISYPFVLPGLSERWSGALSGAFSVLTILQLAFWGRVLVRAFLNGIVAKNAQDASTLESAQNLIGLFANAAIFAIATVMVLDNLGQDVGALIAGLGVGGIAIALAAQNVVKDLFASLSIIFDRPFVKGDFVSWGGNSGTVERIGLKTSRIRALSGEMLIVPNDDLTSTEIHNYKNMAERRIVQRVGVTYDTPRSVLEALPERIKAIVEARDMLRFDRSHMAGYGDSSIDFEFVYYVLARDYATHMTEQQAVLIELHKLFEELGAEFAFPSRTIYISREDTEKLAAAS